jgi:hypothetical protein
VGSAGEAGPVDADLADHLGRADPACPTLVPGGRGQSIRQDARQWRRHTPKRASRAGARPPEPPIPKTSLRPDDLLINPALGGAGHVVIFDHWTDPGTKTRYVGYEQSGDGGTHHRLIEYSHFGGYPLTPHHQFS